MPLKHADLDLEPPDDSSGNVGGWARKIQALRDVLERPSGAAVVAVAVLIAALSINAGWIPSTMTQIHTELAAHRADTAATLGLLNRLVQVAEKQTRVLQYRECATLA